MNEDIVVELAVPPVIIVDVTVSSPTVVEVTTGTPGRDGYSADMSTKTAAVTLSGHRMVALDNVGNLVYADNLVYTGVFGMTLNSANALASTVIQTRGEVTESSWNWTVGNPVYLSITGLLTQTIPSSGVVLQVAMATGLHSVFIDIKVPIRRL